MTWTDVERDFEQEIEKKHELDNKLNYVSDNILPEWTVSPMQVQEILLESRIKTLVFCLQIIT